MVPDLIILAGTAPCTCAFQVHQVLKIYSQNFLCSLKYTQKHTHSITHAHTHIQHAHAYTQIPNTHTKIKTRKNNLTLSR